MKQVHSSQISRAKSTSRSIMEDRQKERKGNHRCRPHVASWSRYDRAIFGDAVTASILFALMGFVLKRAFFVMQACYYSNRRKVICS